jgi:hypothetical protein
MYLLTMLIFADLPARPGLLRRMLYAAVMLKDTA